MGDFSRDPKDRLADSIRKHYVGVRMQQGVPILDADWNELEDLRKHELQELFRQFIGNGVPISNDGFRILALANGGVGTIVLTAKTSVGDFSSLEIDFSTSTAASTLGFLPGRAYMEHYGSSLARLTGNASESFSLNDGMTLTVKTNGEDGETVTFTEDDFEDISQATAEEVVGVLNTALVKASAQVGTGNDFVICGGDGTTENAGRILVGGKESLNETDLTYTSQPLFKNAVLAEIWGVDIVPELEAPSDNDRQDIVYVDEWEREVSAIEDEQIVQPSIGIETAIRLKREWAVRVVENATDLSSITRLPGHQYLILARLDRKIADEERILEERITDLRKRQLTLADVVVSPIHVKGPFGLDKVNSGLFTNMLQTISQVYRDLLESDHFLADNFSDITPVESVKVLKSFQDVRNLAESGIIDASLKRLDNQAALTHMRRLYEVQRNFVDSMLELTTGKSQRAGTEMLLNALETWLEGDGMSIPGLRISVMINESPDLGEAYEAQIFINNEIGRRTGILPQGLLIIQFVSAPSEAIASGGTYEFVYSIHSVLNVDETVELAVTDTLEVFNFVFKDLDEDPNYPGDPSKAVIYLEKGQTTNVAFDLIVPAIMPVGTQSRIIFAAKSLRNPDEIDFSNVEISITVGSTVTLPASNLLLNMIFPEINQATDVVPVGKASENKHITFQIEISYLVHHSIIDEFIFTVDFIGETSDFEVLGATTLNPFDLQGSIQDDDSIIPLPFNIPVGASDTAVDGQERLMIIRLFKTDPTLAQPFFRELHIRVVVDIA